MLDTSQSVGEAIGPALATILWQSGGVFALFGVRIVIAVVAEILALRVFGELGNSASGSEPGTSVNHDTPREQPAGRRFRVRRRADI